MGAKTIVMRGDHFSVILISFKEGSAMGDNSLFPGIHCNQLYLAYNYSLLCRLILNHKVIASSP